MADVKWIKIAADLFDDEKILLIESMPKADTTLIIWLKLLCLAGKQNNGGAFTMGGAPYTDKMLATVMHRPLATVKAALKTFEEFGMVETVDGVVTITNWEKHQNIEGLQRVREQNRQRTANHRARKRMGMTAKGKDCAYCGKPADAIDHIIPTSKGGTDTLDNMVPCCKSCNSSKVDKDLADFLNDSFSLEHQGIRHDLVQSNETLMRHVTFDGSRYVTLRHALEEDKNKNKEKREEKSVTFSRPSLEEVEEYIARNGYAVDAQGFVDFYESNGWKVGKNPMKSWQAAVRTWHGRDSKDKPKPDPNAGKAAHCPGCGSTGRGFWKNTQTGKYFCERCRITVEKDRVVWQ